MTNANCTRQLRLEMRLDGRRDRAEPGESTPSSAPVGRRQLVFLCRVCNFRRAVELPAAYCTGQDLPWLDQSSTCPRCRWCSLSGRIELAL